MPFFERDVYTGETFADLDLTEHQVADKEFYNCTFRNCKLGVTAWPACRFESCIFDDCDLVRMNPTRAGLHGVELKRCRLMGIDWSHVSRNPELKFTECNMRYSSFVGINLRKTEFFRCAVVDSHFNDTLLNEATMHECDLAHTTFRRCDLTKADLSQTRGVFIDPKENIVKNLRIPLEAAVALALEAGMKVAGYSLED